MLSWTQCHILRRRDIDHGRLAGVGVRHPYRYRKAVRRTAKCDWQRACDEQQERRRSIFVCIGFGSDVERRVVGKGFRRVVICAINVRVFINKDAVQPIQYFLAGHWGVGGDLGKLQDIINALPLDTLATSPWDPDQPIHLLPCPSNRPRCRCSTRGVIRGTQSSSSIHFIRRALSYSTVNNSHVSRERFSERGHN